MPPFVQICPKEKQLIQALSQLFKQRNITCLLQHSDQITNGDVHIGEIKNTQKQTHFCLERKTISDLRASIVDGRYKQQTSRLDALRKSDSSPVLGVGYIVEQVDKTKCQETDLEQIFFSIRYKHLMILKLTKNMEETCQFILSLAMKVSSYISHHSLPEEASSLIGLPTKKDHKEIKNASIFLKQLNLVLPLQKAIVVASQYKSMRDLQSAWYAHEEKNQDPRLLLVGMKDKSGKNGIGRTLSDKVYDAFYMSRFTSAKT